MRAVEAAKAQVDITQKELTDARLNVERVDQVMEVIAVDEGVDNEVVTVVDTPSAAQRRAQRPQLDAVCMHSGCGPPKQQHKDGSAMPIRRHETQGRNELFIGGQLAHLL
jgi:hypothetical protein